MHARIAVGLFIAMSWSGAQAQGDAPADYPAKPIRIMIGFTPGGGPDITARQIALRLSEVLKQQVLVEHRPGAGGTIAAGMVARAAPDGYTLLSVSASHAIAPAIYSKLPYDTLTELSGITQTGSSKYVLVAAPAAGIGSLKELIAAAKARPGQLYFSSAGVGSGTHFAAEIFRAMAGIDAVHVPFKGLSEALGEVMAGRIQFTAIPIANVSNQVKAGKVVGLAVGSPQRDALLPEVPSADEAGMPGYKPEAWYGLLTSSAVPRSIIAKLNREVTRILAEPELQQRLSAVGIEPRPSTPEAFDRLVRDEVALLTKVARAANIKAD
jgi:tripartite-type tricarboxylate transporter receptor subunit TctC